MQGPESLFCTRRSVTTRHKHPMALYPMPGCMIWCPPLSIQASLFCSSKLELTPAESRTIRWLAVGFATQSPLYPGVEGGGLRQTLRAEGRHARGLREGGCPGDTLPLLKNLCTEEELAVGDGLGIGVASARVGPGLDREAGRVPSGVVGLQKLYHARQHFWVERNTLTFR